MNKGPLPLHVRDSLLLNPTNYTVCCVWLFLHLQKLKLKLIFLCVEPCCSLESQSYKVRLLPLKKGRPCGYGNGGKGGMGTWTVSFVPMSVTSLGPFIIPSSWDSWWKAPALPSECNCATIPGFIFKVQFRKEEMCLWVFWVPGRLKMWPKGDPGYGVLLLGRFYLMQGDNVLDHQLVLGQGMVEQWAWPFSLQTPRFLCQAQSGGCLVYAKLVAEVSGGSHCSHKPPLLL